MAHHHHHNYSAAMTTALLVLLFACDFPERSHAAASCSQFWLFLMDFGDRVGVKNIVVYFDPRYDVFEFADSWSDPSSCSSNSSSSSSPALVSFVPLDGTFPMSSYMLSSVRVVVGSFSAVALREAHGGGSNVTCSESAEHPDVRCRDYWLFQLDDIDDGDAIEKALEGFMDLTYNSLVFTFRWNAQTNLVRVNEVYRIPDDSSGAVGDGLEVRRYGHFEDGRMNLTSEGALSIWERRANMRGFTFRIAVLRNPPYITYVEDNCTKPSCMQGMYADVWHSLQQVMNFTYRIIQPQTRAWGNLLEDGVTWSGMIGQLLADEIDISPAEYTITELRSRVVDFNLPVSTSHQKFFVKNPAESFNWTAFLEPLSWACWYVILAAAFVLPVFISHCAKAVGDEPSSSAPSLGSSFSLVAGGLMLSSSPFAHCDPPRRTRNRIAFVSVLLMGSLVYWHWEAMLISFLQVRKTILPFLSMEELYSGTGLKVIVPPGTSYVDTFRHGHTQLLRDIYADRIEPHIHTYPINDKEAVGKMAASNPSFTLFDNFYTTIEYDAYKSCQIVPIPVEYFPVRFAFAFQKNSPYFDAFWYQLNKMKERGATQQILEKYEAGPQVCPDYSGKPLGMGQCFTGFLLLFAGMAAGFMLLVFEGVRSRRPFIPSPPSSLPVISVLPASDSKSAAADWAAKVNARAQLSADLEFHQRELRRHQVRVNQLKGTIRMITNQQRLEAPE